MNYVQFHWGDWVRSTQDLTPLERGIYIDLLQRYYLKERPLTDDECSRIARAYRDEEQKAMQYVLQTFFKREANAWRHDRCDEEIAKFNDISAKRSAAGRKSRASKDGVTTNKSDGKVTSEDQLQSKCSANDEQLLNKCTSTHYPLPITHSKEEESNDSSRPAAAAAAPANPPAAASPAIPAPNLFEDQDINFPRKGGVPPCPYKQIVDLYHEILPEFPRVNKLSPNRQAIVRARWKEVYVDEGCKSVEECLENFRYIFGMVRESDFLMGRTPRGKDHENWQPTFMWLMQQEKFLKLTNREYQ